MLVLSRRLNEALEMTIPAGTVFNKEAKITVRVVKAGKQIKIGVEAPKSVRVLRDELADLDNPPFGHQEAHP